MVFMKKIFSISVLILLLILTLYSCSSKDKDTYIYVGKSQSWLATYSIIKVGTNYYDSLSIQYMFDDENSILTEKISPVEFHLKGNSTELSTSYPQDLKGVANLHTGTIYNSETILFTFDDYVELTICWKDKEETFKLSLYK